MQIIDVNAWTRDNSPLRQSTDARHGHCVVHNGLTSMSSPIKRLGRL